MAHMQHKNHTFRRIGTNEYGLRDVDIVMVPKEKMTFEAYERSCQAWIDSLDALLNALSV